MQNLQQLIAAGFNQGRDGAPGLDRTVSSLEWALANIGSSGTALAYAADAAGSLEARLIATYAIQALAHLKSGDRRAAEAEYTKARQLHRLSNSTSSFGGAHSNCIESTLADLEQMFEQQFSMAA